MAISLSEAVADADRVRPPGVPERLNGCGTVGLSLVFDGVPYGPPMREREVRGVYVLRIDSVEVRFSRPLSVDCRLLMDGV